MTKKVCLIYNFAQHYRAGIFKLLDEGLNCDFYFGNSMDDVKQLDYSILTHFKKELKNKKIFSSIYWQSGVLSLVFKNYRYYIILGEYYCLSTWLLLILLKFSNKKVFLWTHGWYGNESWIKKIVKKIFFSLGDKILLYGNYAKELMIEEGFDSNKLHVIYNSLNYDEQLRLRKNLKINNLYNNQFENDDHVLLFIGRLSKVKKLNQFIEAHALLLDSGFKCNLVLIGKGVEEESLKALSKKLGTYDRTWFYGPCYDESIIGNLVYNASLCVSPGNVGLTAIHSLAFGTPVITHSDFSSQMPEFESIISGVSGDFFDYGDIDSLAKVIKEWLLNNNDRSVVADRCFEVIDKCYNPNYQFKIINDLVK